MNRLRKFKAVLWIIPVVLLAAVANLTAQHDGGPSSSAPAQPVPYSHKKHLAMGLKCGSCHQNPDPGEVMGFPAEKFCMGCHQAVKTDSPHIQKIAGAASQSQPLAWTRIYQLPQFVYFSHRVHVTKAGESCETCHGPVRERDVMTREVQLNMKSCMACHAAKHARNDCSTCHEEK